MKKNLRAIIAFTLCLIIFTIVACSNTKDNGNDDNIDIVTYTVTFDSNGGSIVSSVTAQDNETISKPTDPTKAGYSFDAWYKDSGFVSEWDFSKDTVTSDITLYANYNVSSYKVSFDTDGGTEVPSITVTYNSEYGVLPTTTKEEYYFIGWFYNNTPINENTIVTATSDHTLVANYEDYGAEFIVTFDSNGGSIVGSQTVSVGSTLTEPTNPTKTGYTFEGWYSDVDFMYKWDFDNNVVNYNITLYANWTANSYQLDFDTDGGEDVRSIQVVFGNPYGELPVATKVGYTFDGWFFGANAIEITAQTIVTNASRHTVVAHWRENGRYNVIFDKNNDEPNDTDSVLEGTTVVQPSDPIKSGYTFEGWYYKNIDNNPVKYDFDTVVSSSITLYAYYTYDSIPLELMEDGDSYGVVSDTDPYPSRNNMSGNIIIQSEYNGLPVSHIDYGGFMYYNKIDSLIIPDSITSIGNFAFDGTNITQIVIPSSVISTGYVLFNGWTEQQTIYIMDYLEVPEGWFEDWNLNCNAKIVLGYTL